MATKHKLRATIPHGPKDMGAELDCEIAFTYHSGRMAHMTAQWKGGYPHPDEADEIEFIDAAPIICGKPAPFPKPFERLWLNQLAEDWLYTDEGQAAAMAEVLAEAEDARAFIAESRRDAR